MTGPTKSDKSSPKTQPNALAQLQAPWRLEYLESLANSQSKSPIPNPTKDGNFLAQYWVNPKDDQANHVLIRSSQGLVLLNAYPYSNGHLLVALGDPRPNLLDYQPAQRAALWLLVELATELCQKTLNCQGINIGINQGRAAGAGVPGHLHIHIVPRWAGDTNFMSVVGQVRVASAALDKMAQRYQSTLSDIQLQLQGK